MGWNWHNYEQAWQRRRKNSDEKRMWRDVQMTKDNEGTFHLTFMPKEWVQDANGRYTGPTRVARYPLAKITSDNVLTLLYNGQLNMTVCNRLSTIIDRPVWSDTTHHRNKEIKVRIRPAVWDRKAQQYITDSWYPKSVSPSNWAHGTIPYKAGLMFQLNSFNGNPDELLTPVEDITIAVKNDAIQRAKADTKIMRVLVRSMARMGSFDEPVNRKLERGWLDDNYMPKRLDEVNYKQPMGDDATAVFVAGLAMCATPAHSHYVNGTWTRRPTEERREAILSAAIDNGMKQLRKHIYSTTDGYERKVK